MTIGTEPPAPVSSFDVAIASGVKDRLKLRDILIAGTEGRLVGEGDEGSKLSIDFPRVDVRWFRDGNDLRVVVPYALNIVARKERTPAPGVVAEIRVLLRIDYAVNGDVSDDEVTHFVGLSTFLHSWPYFRAEVAGLTTKLRLPPLTLPVALSGNAEHCFIVSKLRPEDAGMSADAPATDEE